MSTVLTTIAAALATLFAMMAVLQLAVRVRARALKGKPVPTLPGAMGERIGRSKNALVYFFSPGCAACRPMTPKLEALRQHNGSVFLVDVSQDFDTARALKVMATPSTVEIADGKVVGFHIGALPPEVVARFS